MSQNKLVEDKVQAYLAAVHGYLGSLSGEEAEEILSSIRGHIDGELERIADGSATLAQIEQVLASMDPPESYAQGASELLDIEPPPARFAKQPIIGAIFLPFGVIMALMMFIAVPGGGGTTTWQWIARFTILPLGILAPFVCTVMGFMGISAIRQSQGKLMGMPLALLDALFYPVIILDALLFTLALWLFEGVAYLNIILGVVVLLMLLVDYFITRLMWRAAIKP